MLLFHVLGAAAWIGGGLFAMFAFTRLVNSGDEGAGSALERIAAGADRYFGPAAVVTLLTGIGLVLVSDAFGWGDAFVLIGIGALSSPEYGNRWWRRRQSNDC